MLISIIGGALRNRLFVVVAGIALAAVGTIIGLRLPIDVLPDLNRPTVTIMTEAHGLRPIDVEQRITLPIERAVNGAVGVERVRSSSGTGLSVVTVEFGWDTELFRNRQVVQEKLQLALPRLPPDARPSLAPISSLMGQIQLIGVRSRSGDTDPAEVRAIVDQQVTPRLRSVPGVAQALATGSAPRQLQVIVDARRLAAFDVTLPEVAEAIRDANHSGSGGVLEAGVRGPLVTVSGRLEQASDLEQAVVRSDAARPVRVADIGEVTFGPSAIRVGEAGIDGGPGTIVVVMKQPSIDTLALTAQIDRELEQLQKTLPADLEIVPDLYRQADFIERAVDNVIEAVRDGALLVVIVLFLFLLNFRTTLITLTAIPLSLAITAIFFHFAGISINTMTLGGIAVAIGALVDDAIVDVENVFRRLKQNRDAGSPTHPIRVVFFASNEVRKPILIGTLVVTSVYLPLFAMSGIEGRLFSPIGVAYIASIMASLLVSLTLTPVLCYYLLPNAHAVTEPKDGWLVRRLRDTAARAIRFSVAAPRTILVGASSLGLFAVLLLATTGSEFLPAFNEGTVQVSLFLPPGTSIDTSDHYGRRLEQAVKTVAEVQHVARRTGRAEGDEHVMGVETNEMILELDPHAERSRSEILTDIRERVEDALPGVPFAVEQPLAHLLSHLLSGVYAQVAVKISGTDLPVLRRLGEDVEAALEGVAGVTDLVVEPQVLTEQVDIRPDRVAMAGLGVRAAEIAETIELAMAGEEVSRLNRGPFIYPIVVRLRPEDRADLGALRALRVRDAGGRPHNIDDVASVGWSREAYDINRENMTRRIVVQHNVAGRSLGEVVADVEAALDPIRAGLPPGYAIRTSGQFEAQQEAQRVLLLLSFLSLAMLVLLLYSHFRSFYLAAQTLLSVPAAFLGGAAFVVLSGQTLSIATLVGFIALAGIAARNTILLLDHYLHLMREEDCDFSIETLVRAGRERVIPVLMTALTTGIGLMPLVLFPGEPGRELLYPVASVIVGGLVTSTLLDLLLTPGVFWMFGRAAAEQCIAHRLKLEPAAARMAERLED